MNKNLLFSVLGIFILIGVTWVLAGAISSIDSVTLKLNGSKSGAYVGNWTSANESGGNVINFTIATNTPENLTLINISILSPTNYIYVDGNASDKEILNLTYNQTIHYSGIADYTGGGAPTCGETANMVYCYNSTGGITTNISGDPGTPGNNLWFLIDANNTQGVDTGEGPIIWNISIRSNSTSYAATGTIASTTVTTMGIDNAAPRLVDLNVSNTDGTNNIGSRNNNTAETGFSAGLGASNTSFIRNDTDVVVRLVVNESNMRGSSVVLLWNISSVPPLKRELIMNHTGSIDRVGNFTLNSSSAGKRDDRAASQLRIFSFTIAKGNLTNYGVLSLAVFVNDTFNQTLANNNAGNGYNIVIDGLSPSASITMPTVTIIDVQKSITIKCFADDAAGGSGSTSVELKITKPSGNTVTVDVTDDGEHKFTGSDTGEAGEYKVDCTTTDKVGYEGSATQETFRTLYSTVPGIGAAVAPAPTEIPEIPKQGESKGLKQGESITYTILGEKHSITADRVGVDEVDLTIESDPIKVTVKVGTTEFVDINGDGGDDLEIKLNSITDKKADLTFKDVSKERAEEEEVVPEEVTEEVAPSKTNLWITIIIIIVVLVIIFLAIKGKKGKKGQIRFTREELRSSSEDLI